MTEVDQIGGIGNEHPINRERAKYCIAGCGRKAVFWNPFNGVVECHSCGRMDALLTAEMVQLLLRLLTESSELIAVSLREYTKNASLMIAGEAMLEQIESVLPVGAATIPEETKAAA